MKKILSTPLTEEMVEELTIGDVFYLNGQIVTSRDMAHQHFLLKKNEMPADLKNGAVFHAGPIVKQDDKGQYQMISVGPTTSMRMETLAKEFMESTGIRLMVGKGGMGEKTTEACQRNKVIHCMIPGGCAVSIAHQIIAIEKVEWLELGMPEALWFCRVKEFGPLVVTIDTKGNNLFANNRLLYQKRKEEALANLKNQVSFLSDDYHR
ncbi:L(+)-tartrate dehydratase beta subunit [Tindallia magadiensis]|uniref:L(+)-tartrate dehydratase subunit beta n=1 Tax=Tindallia magadiensis TaxID=69895 RepID=A0A1I3BB05_9FIRM|nr:L(+)-tartrate dehydratase subunit beta [Tindallia magadiensis]SFH59483.1 L(+)-tartrate dehydratase beta subunit [Tindallia magadiensis]